MSRIVLGKSDGHDIHLDVPTLLRTHLLIWASTGGGKSFLIRRLAEQLFGKVPVIILDREGEFSTLREKFGFVLVGPGGETPADPRSAKMVVHKLLELRASAVIDLFELSQEARHEWVRNYFLALVDAPKQLWGPLVNILDEAHTFNPEKGQGESCASGAINDFNGVARKRGFASVMATQRLSKLSKNATAEMYNQAAGPTATQSDRERAAYEMGIPKGAETKEFSEVLRKLPAGNFFFQGRAIAMDRVLVAVGPVETSHGGLGTGKHKYKAPPTPDQVKV
jgi:DNA helicase HerA-like ATPase